MRIIMVIIKGPELFHTAIFTYFRVQRDIWAVLLLTLLFSLGLAVAPGGCIGAPFDETEYFDTNNTVNDWSRWQPTDANGVPNGSPGSNGWLMTRNTNTLTSGSTLTPSAGTGPTSVHTGGVNGGFLFLENSGSPPYPDRYFTRKLPLDASAHNLNISFAYALYGAGMGSLQLQVNDGGGWRTEWQQIGNDGKSGAWSTVSIDLYNGTGLTGTRYYGKTTYLRFRFVSGSTYQGDAALDSIRVFGPESCVETASVSLNNIPSPITGPTAISASLGGIGGTNPQVSIDGANWSANGWTYTPPAASTGITSFYARATGVCGTYIYDPFNPAEVSYDTTCSDPTPSTINVPVGQVVTGSAVDLASLFSVTGNVGSFSYKINGNAVYSPWNSSSYGTTATEVVALQISGIDPECGGKTLVKTAYVTVDNTCVVNPVTFGFDRVHKYADAGESAEYTLTVYNNDEGTCESETFTVSVLGNSDNEHFTGTLVDDNPLTIAPGGTATIALNVAIAEGTAEWLENQTTVHIDAGGHADPADYFVTTTVYKDTPLMHNSIRTNSSKHDGKWGTSQPGAKYGKFTCETCHQRSTGNIKRIREILPSAQDTSQGDFPGSGQAVSFLDVREGSADFGDDSRAVKSSSNRICEVCHTFDAGQTVGVNKHAYNMTGATFFTHYNKSDCTVCHDHQNGFRAGCTACHGDPVTDIYWADGNPNAYPDRLGAHRAHVEKIGNFLASGNKDNEAFTSVEHRNASCGFCHPDAGGSNVDGGSHMENTVGTPADVGDVHGDGHNASYFKYLDGANDIDGTYNLTTKRCSNIDCHSNGHYTWAWYGDVLSPAAVTNLNAETGSVIGAVDLNWTAPGNDSDTSGKAYRIEVRYAATDISSEAAWNAATVAGGPPSAKWPGALQTMTVHGLNPGSSYYFAVRTADESGNWSPLSNRPVAVAKADQEAPSFRGLETALPTFTSGAVNLAWPAASDHSEPIDYLVWWRPSDQVIDYGQSPNAQTSGLSFHVSGLPDGTNYNFAVRARDMYGNIDSNTVQKEAIPQSAPEKDWLGRTYYAGLVSGASCGSTITYGGTIRTGSLADGYSCGVDTRNTVSSGTYSGPRDIARWTTPSPYAQAMNITGGSLRIYVRDRNSTAQTVTIRLGYANDATGNGFVELGNVVKSFKRDFRGLVSFSLGTITGTVPAGKHLCMIFNKTTASTAELQFRYASERNRSELTVYEQIANARPNAFAVSTPAPGTPAGSFDINWGAAVDPDGDSVKYDVYGELTDGSRYVISEKISNTTVSWDSLADGIGLSAAETGVVIRVEATDGLTHNEGGTFYDRREAVSDPFTIDNRNDVTAPMAVTDLAAEHRPKSGSVYLYWSAPGDDVMDGRASRYDIRYSAGEITEANFASATEVSGEPVPGEPGYRQGYEVLGLSPDQTYYFALKTADETPNWSGLSNVPAQKGGPSCGVCHSTPPDETGRDGMHEQHGYTQVDCAKCHGFESINYGNAHSDGVNKLAYNNPKKGFTNVAHGPVTETAERVTYHAGGTAGGVVIYDDVSGGGGFNDINPGGDDNDNGSCFGFNATGVTGCHGAAGSDPDGPGPLPTYPAPAWGNIASVSCAMCHGDPNRVDETPFNRPFEDGTRDQKYAGNVKIYKSAPAIDLSGRTDSQAVGQHLIHLNFSYRFTGDSCALCHQGSEHADGTVDVRMDTSVAGVNAQWNPNAGGPGTPGTCSGTSELRCHGNNAADPEWKVREEPNTKLVDCNECHGFTGKTYNVAGNSSQIPHVSDGGQVRHCTWCHVEGHPREGYSISAATKSNPVQLTSARHGLETGDTVVLQIEGMDELDHRFATVTVVDSNNFVLLGIDSSSFGNFVSGYWKRSYPAHSISAITKANPAVVTSPAHGLATGDNILLNISGMTQLDRYHGPVTVIDANTFSLDGVNSTSYATFSSGAWVPDDGAILLPNYAIAGIDYSSGGIHLKRVVNGRSTLNNGELVDSEAETCWACHEDQSPLISEWGTNTKALTGNSTYDYGSLDKASWEGAIWTSPNFAYKTAALASTHSVNPQVLGPGADSNEQLRCSYCHDVHDLNKSIGDVAFGAPYLRGTWKGNPYKEDGAPGRYPGFTSTYYTQLEFGRVPRGTPSQQKMGGYWIDQNSGYPTASWTLSNSAGLCTLCHGSDVNNMNKFGNAADDWIGANGHSNSAIGGSSLHRSNIYNPTLRREGTTYTVPGMGYQDTTGADGTEMYGLRNAQNSQIQPYAANGDYSTYRPFAYQEFNWGLDRETGTTPEAAEFSYHRFSCSKCHNPHASRLPRLMITNCLDVSHNTWDNDTTYYDDTSWSSWKDRGIMPYNGTDPTGGGVDKQMAYATSAQNCHRYVDVNGDGTPDEAGWNKVTPWRE